MLRIVIVFFCFLTTVSHAEPIRYKEPENKALKSAKDVTQDVVDKVDTLMKDDDFLTNLQVHRQIINNISNHAKSGLYNLQDFNPEIYEERIISKALAAGEQLQDHSTQAWTSSPIVLVSLSMPERKIKSLMSEAAKVGANIVLRGAIDNDIGKTIAKIQQLSTEIQLGGIQIDPTLFRRFNVTIVPTFILPLEPVKTCDQHGCAVPEHVRAHGTASLLYFLEKTSRLGNKKEKVVAENWLSVYRGGNSGG